MSSLLGEFYSKIKGSQEDIASEGLAYILQRSNLASNALRRMIERECGINLPELEFRTQVAGDKLERPDISGFENSTERIIIEAKFWASLTANQPLEYLKRLSGESGALVFVCPNQRVGLLWDELLRRLHTDDSDRLIIKEPDHSRHLVELTNNRFLFVVAWKQILDSVRDTLVRADERALISDLDQIIGFCQKMDDIAFLPILDTDLSPSNGKRIYSYYLLVDKLLDELRKHVSVDLTGLRATPQYGGYVRYFRASGLALSLTLNFKFWYEHAETPFWIGLYGNDGKNFAPTVELNEACKEFDAFSNVTSLVIAETRYYPLFPLTNQPEQVVLENLSKTIIHIITTISNIINTKQSKPVTN